MEQDDPFDLNFWPAVADMMLALVLILVLVLTSVAVLLGGFDLRPIQDQQMEFIAELAATYGAGYDTLQAPEGAQATYGVPLSPDDNRHIVIRNEAILQTITFSDRILFPKNEYLLNAEGEKVLSDVGRAILHRRDVIQQIQIQGHADTDPTQKYESNLKLAALRAVSVFT